MSDVRVLYWVNGSIPSWQVMLALYEKQLMFESCRLRVMTQTRQTRTPEFLAINPRGQAPVLVEPDGTIVLESFAILHYLEQVEPGNPLLPQDPKALALTLGRMYEVENLRKAYRPLEQLFLPAQLTEEKRIAIANVPAAVERELIIWEELASSAFIAGDQFSLADCVFYPALAYQLRRGLTLKEFPRLSDYMKRIWDRESAKQAYPVGWKEKGTRRNLFWEAKKLRSTSSSQS